LDFPAKELDRKTLLALRDLGFAGVNVTVPHKEWAYDMSSVRGKSAETGAVNTIKFGTKHIIGENTDVYGFRRLLGAKIYIGKNTRCLVVGAGGVARAVVHVLREKGGQVKLTDVDMERARGLGRRYRARAVTIGALWKLRKDFDLIVNCSPIGMKGVSDDSPVKPYLFRPGVTFIDVVFNPPVTTAMKVAKRSGAEAVGGLEMLVQQGAESFRFWTGRRPDVDVMREAARRALE
jgi:shikimate dehydrogenase